MLPWPWFTADHRSLHSFTSALSCSSQNSETQTIKATTKKSCVGEYPKCPHIIFFFNIRPTIKSGESFWSILMTWSRNQFVLPSPSPAKDSGGEFDLRRTGLGEAHSWRHGKAQRHRVCSDHVWGAAAMRPHLSFPFPFCLKKKKDEEAKTVFMVCNFCVSNNSIHLNDGMLPVLAPTFLRGYRWVSCAPGSCCQKADSQILDPWAGLWSRTPSRS